MLIFIYKNQNLQKYLIWFPKKTFFLEEFKKYTKGMVLKGFRELLHTYSLSIKL